MNTVPDLVIRACRAHADRIAVVDGPRRLRFADIGDRIARVANLIGELAPQPSARVAILMRNRLEYVEIDFGIACAGKVKVAINPRLADDERAYVLRDAGVALVFTEEVERQRVESVVSSLVPRPRLVVLDSEGRDYESMLGQASSVLAPIAPDPSALSLLLYTSGTTGRPKGAMITDANRIAATTMMLTEEYAVTPTDGMIHAGPMSHGSGSKVLAYFSRGARNVVMPKFTTADMLRCTVESGGTSTFLVPTMIQMIVDDADTVGVPRLRNVSYGGAPISRPTLEAALQRLGPVLTQVYGTSEAPHPVTVLRHRELDDPALSDLAGIPAGWPVSAVQLRLVAIDHDRATPAVDIRPGDGQGELWVAGPNVMDGYWQRPDATAETIVDGWYRTGDVATIGDDRLVHILDRSRDLIITGGLNVYPAEVERVLGAHPAVTAVSVVGIADDKWGEAVGAAVVLGTNAGVDELLAWSAERLAGYKQPRVMCIVDALPQGSTGKVAKHAVRDLLVAQGQEFRAT